LGVDELRRQLQFNGCCLDPAVFAREIALLDRRSRYSHIPSSIRHGFDLGIRSPPPVSLVIPNRLIDPIHVQLARDAVTTDLDNRWVVGPCTLDVAERAFGCPIQASPTFLVPKHTPAGEAQKWRRILHLSAPRKANPVTGAASVNSRIRRGIGYFRADWTPLVVLMDEVSICCVLDRVPGLFRVISRRDQLCDLFAAKRLRMRSDAERCKCERDCELRMRMRTRACAVRRAGDAGVANAS
jgi:hypothetical protein